MTPQEQVAPSPKALNSKKRRDNRRNAELCINSGPRSKVAHGPVVRSGKCDRCVAVWKQSR